MGLEAIIFFYNSKEKVKSILEFKDNIEYKEGNRYIYKKENCYWIDIEFIDLYSLSIRITLSNPMDYVLQALFNLLSLLFSLGEGVLIDQNTKQVFTTYNEEMKEAIKKSYLERRKIFQDIYGNYTSAIGSDDFYRKQNERKKNDD